MKGESAISSWQLTVLLFLSRITYFFLAEPQPEGPQALTAAIWMPVSILASFLLLLPACLLMRKHKGKGLLDIAGERWGKLGFQRLFCCLPSVCWCRPPVPFPIF